MFSLFFLFSLFILAPLRSLLYIHHHQEVIFHQRCTFWNHAPPWFKQEINAEWIPESMAVFMCCMLEGCWNKPRSAAEAAAATSALSFAHLARLQ